MISYGKFKLKQYLGANDFSVDMAEFEKEIRIMLNKVREGRKPAVMRPTNYVISQW